MSVVNVGLPQIASALGFSAVGVTWVIHAYALTFGGLLLLRRRRTAGRVPVCRANHRARSADATRTVHESGGGGRECVFEV